jgi:hypothetical protein
MFHKEIIEKAFESAKNNNAVEFFSLFFNVDDNEDNYELETWTEGGVNMFVTISKKNWKEDFRDYVNGFDVDEEINVIQSDRNYQSAFTYRQSVEDFEDYKKWLVSVLDILDGKVNEEVAEKPIESISVPFNTFVLTFDKLYFKKSNLEVLSDVEKYNIAKDNSKEGCRVYTASEYTEKLNNFVPMEKYVFTYIVNVPVQHILVLK